MKMFQTVAWFMLMTVSLNFSEPTSQGTRLGQSANRGKNIYHDGWIDLNKNGKMDVYENPRAPIDKRIDDLLSQMTLEEKTCQTATL